jgi:transposase
MSPKRTHDAQELYDGVPSLHDAKAAYLVGRLHLDGASQRWQEPTAERRELSAMVAEVELHQGTYQRQLNRLEAQLSRYWPEVLRLLAVDSVALLSVLRAYGSPQAVARQAAAAGALLRDTGRTGLAEAKVVQVVASAATTVGVPCLEPERRYLRALAGEALHSYRGLQQTRHALEQRVAADPALAPMAALVGRVTSAVLIASLGSPLEFPSAASYLKGLGLNLKEHSSGKHQGQLTITKRGPARARQYLYLAVLRWLQREPLIGAWYQAKLQRDGGRKGKALVALMRKLAKALWHGARGQAFDAAKLIDRQALTGAH